MTNKTSVIKAAGLMLMLMALFVALFPSGSLAFFYRPAAALDIFSEYDDAVKPSSPPRTQTWKVVPDLSPDGGLILRFFSETAAEAVAVCELELPPEGTAGEIRWQGIGKSNEKKSLKGLLLTSGFPAPCNVLPVGENGDSVVCQEKREAGGSVFTRKYLVSTEAFSAVEARARGWIREDTPDITGLVLVTATDDKGQLAVRQLWPVDGSWWLYEETPLRRSWLIY